MAYMVKETIIFKDMDKMAEFVIGKWGELSAKAIRDRGRFAVALSGGKTPVPLYRKLSRKKDMPWNKVHVFLADERFVPYEDECNNYFMINETFLSHVNIPKKNIHPVSTAENTSLKAAQKYEHELLSFFGSKEGMLPRFDLVLLGIGEDGHTASIFPGDPAVKETGRLAVAVSPRDRTNIERITLTLPVINNAENVMFLANGKNKAAIIKKVTDGRNKNLPAGKVHPGSGNLFFLLDESAGKMLSSKPARSTIKKKGGTPCQK